MTAPTFPDDVAELVDVAPPLAVGHDRDGQQWAQWMQYDPPWRQTVQPAPAIAEPQPHADLHDWPTGVAYAISGTTGNEIAYRRRKRKETAR